MITKINSINTTINYLQNKNNNYHTKPIQQKADIKPEETPIQGVPLSYISFKSSQDKPDLKFSVSAEKLINDAQIFATTHNHNEISPYHVILAAIAETEIKINQLAQTKEDIGDSPISTLHNLVNGFAKKNVLLDEVEQEFFIEETSNLKKEVLEKLNELPVNEDIEDKNLNFSKEFQKQLEKIASNTEELNEYMLLATAFNTLTFQNINFPAEYIAAFQSLGLYKTNDEVNGSYLEAFDNRAVEMWNKLALGSNLFVLAKNPEDKNRIMASFVNTLGVTKHGNFNSDNTLIYAIADDVEPGLLIQEIEAIKMANPDNKIIYLMDLDNMLTKLVDVKGEDTLEYKPELFKLLELGQDNAKFIFLQNEKDNFQLMLIPPIKKAFSKFINYNIPPIQSYEVNNILRKNKDLLKDVKKSFKSDAKEKAIILAEKMEGAYPDKAVELMKRISEYYGDEVSKITSKEVDEFAYIAGDIFKQDKNETPIVYNTGKTLSTYYGKETTKKDIENIVKQIKTGRIGTRGYIITSKDEEAGAGKKYTAEVIAGEAKVPFLEINTSDFAMNAQETSSKGLTAALNMTKIFSDIKLAAKQNPYKTAILFINNFEDFVFSDSYYSEYKQAKTQLSREMDKAINDDINILVIGSTREGYAEYVPMFIKDFSQKIVVDSPAFNKKSRKEILNNVIAKNGLPLFYKTKQQKEELIDKLVKLTEYFSYVEIKNLINKTEQIMLERNKNRAGIGEFIEAYLQEITGRTSQPEMPIYNKRATTSHECGHATNLEIMNRLYEAKGEPWHKSRDVKFITLDPRGNFLGAVFEGKGENIDYPFEAMFSDLVCAYGGHSCEKQFFNMDGSSGISQDLAQATSAAKRAIEYFGLGYYTGKISNAANIHSGKYHENVYQDLNVLLTNAQIVSDLITEGYKDFNIWFTNKYSKLIGTDNCMIDGDDFRKQLQAWIASQPARIKEELSILDDMILDIIKASKNGKIYYQAKKVVK